MALFDMFDNAFANLLEKYGNHSYILMPTASVTSPNYVPYLISWFKPAGMAKLKSVALSATYGKGSPLDLYYQDNWDIAYANYSTSELLNEIRNSILNSEVVLNNMIQNILAVNPSIQIISYSAGPTPSAANYGYRAGRNAILNCASDSAGN